MNYKNEKTKNDGIERVVNVDWLGTGMNDWEDLCRVVDEWIELNKDIPEMKKIIMEDYGFKNDDEYEELMDEERYLEFYDWFCDNTETNRQLYMNSRL
jgi:hypothetical protein